MEWENDPVVMELFNPFPNEPKRGFRKPTERPSPVQ